MRKVLVAALIAGAFTASADDGWVKGIISKDILPAKMGVSSEDAVFSKVAEADIAADRAWQSLKSRAEYDAYRKAMHEKYVEAIGGFPERTALNPITVDTFKFDGYIAEKVMFESHPGVYVTANLYLPDSPRFRPPYKACLVTCGHSQDGKGDRAYGRMGVMAAKAGLACLVYDPISQGERIQVPSTMNVMGHYRLGVLAALLGKSMALFRIWDGIRAMDYLDSRADIEHGEYGIMGNSGGGTMTSLIMSIDPRVKAGAPSCFISTISDVFSDIGPQDSEQVIFGQLAFGLNHSSFVLLGDNPVRMHCVHSDFFAFRGSLRTFDVVKTTARNCSLGDRYAMTDVQGPHGWREGARQSTLLWMRRYIAGDRTAPDVDVAKCREADVGFSIYKADYGLSGTNHCVTAEGDVSKTPGFRSVYDILKKELDVVESTRERLSGAKLAAAAAKAAGIVQPDKCGLVVKECGSFATNGVTFTKLMVLCPDALVLPAFLCRPEKETAAPAIVTGVNRRGAYADLVEKALSEGRAVLSMDFIGAGEIGETKNTFYGLKQNKDEGLAAMLYTLGKSLVGERATEMLFMASYMKQLTGKSPKIVACRRMAIAAAHAYGVRRDLVGEVELVARPLSWAEAVRTSADLYSYANTVNGALRVYDWVDLLD